MEKIDEKELKDAIYSMKKEPAFLKLHGKIMVAGDTHGDVVISKAITEKFFDENFDFMIFLGDYIDRAPNDIGSSLPNINHLIEIKIRYPNKIFLLKGNHEANYAIPCWPHEFEYEVKQCCPSFYELYIKAFMEMPLMALANNVYLAHGGFPRKNISINKNDIEAVEEITWSDVALSPVYRGAGFKFDEKMLNDFLNKINAKAFIRGHDYTMNGIVAYKKCLTIFSSRRYKNNGNGGILIAKIYGKINGIEDIELQTWEDGKWIDYKPYFIE